MKRWFPSPVLSLALLAMWLLLNRSLSPGHLLLGVLVGWWMPLLMAPLRPPAGPLRRPKVLARLVLAVGADVIRSAVEVGLGVLKAGRSPPRARFVVVPLDLRDPFGLAALAVITTVVPGTVWTELARDRSELLLHVFDLQHDEEFIRHFKARYEQPLKEIFE
ncbi:Na+/H+ antiporter subunit E [Caldimonas brevitalea]|uniref:Monovalent cation/H+ antiporter subunit E n=1 Tax=Caldimonas brevitalea TaxID=413882 RepID=A0A0G3BKT7_9BURK|nr:Na+/H+ antiporter subunit E [Caldimonas brevitalea]AKJ30069.1 monovalent cation/H+ antiporter subunit E [Caldimonas brevitalea]